ncbi:hypothetical protein J7T55_008179 [Diaporthe amygdali]|uniref:uncharacterized protein n=1 Tax=Phomopsis amygdali TaxID=1214568 RepID=UPI0022FEB2AC|nr:uncharacterized protein J7T55_008179 [Diaporthe amygdali]KAJ0121019.1 hypothetical protein J7T55_008179 [Diaporthe amygdali]
MQFQYLTTLLAFTGAAMALPTANTPIRTLTKRTSADILQTIMPKSASCDGRGDECRTAAQAAPFLVKAMTDYNIGTQTEQGGILALIAYESEQMQYKKNLNNAAAGQGTSNMQMGSFNVQYASSIPALAAKSPTESTVLDLVTADEYNFGTGPWFYSTQCTSAQSAAKSGSADDWFQAYMSCVGVSTSAQPDRLTYWNNAKTALALS